MSNQHDRLFWWASRPEASYQIGARLSWLKVLKRQALTAKKTPEVIGGKETETAADDGSETTKEPKEISAKCEAKRKRNSCRNGRPCLYRLHFDLGYSSPPQLVANIGVGCCLWRLPGRPWANS
jgi:hypothetical protein